MIFNGSLPAVDGEALVRLVASYRASERRQARDDGRTIYAIAAEMGVTQNAVRRMLGLR